MTWFFSPISAVALLCALIVWQGSCQTSWYNSSGEFDDDAESRWNLSRRLEEVVDPGATTTNTISTTWRTNENLTNETNSTDNMTNDTNTTNETWWNETNATNDTNITENATTATTTTTTPEQIDEPLPVAAIILGVLGGLCMILCCFFAIAKYLRNHGKRKEEAGLYAGKFDLEHERKDVALQEASAREQSNDVISLDDVDLAITSFAESPDACRDRAQVPQIQQSSANSSSCADGSSSWEETPFRNGNAGSTPSADSEAIASWVQNVYARYNPSKLSRVETLLVEYRGREEDLVKQVQRKYRLGPEAIRPIIPECCPRPSPGGSKPR